MYYSWHVADELFDLDLLDEEHPFDVDAQAAHLVMHPRLGIRLLVDSPRGRTRNFAIRLNSRNKRSTERRFSTVPVSKSLSGYAATDLAEIIRQEHSVSGWVPINLGEITATPDRDARSPPCGLGLRFIKMAL